MNVLIADHSLAIRLAAFFGIFVLMAAWELLAPRRAPRTAKGRRWRTNLSLTVLDSLAGRIVFFIPGVGLAQPARGHDGMVIGMANFRDPGELTLPKLLALPFTAWRKF